MLSCVIFTVLIYGATEAIVENGPPEGIAVFNDDDIKGNVTFRQIDWYEVNVQGTIEGMPAGQYGFHVHEKGDLSSGCASVGGHFNPYHQRHGGREDFERHVGDLGNVVFNNDSIAHIDFSDRIIALYGDRNIIGRAVVLHHMRDDMGRSDNPNSHINGNSGGRAACAIIGVL